MYSIELMGGLHEGHITHTMDIYLATSVLARNVLGKWLMEYVAPSAYDWLIPVHVYNFITLEIWNHLNLIMNHHPPTPSDDPECKQAIINQKPK